MITKGPRNKPFKHGKNFIDEEANKRFKSLTEPYRQQQLNALGVDYFEVMLFQKVLSTLICTCKQTEIDPQHLSINSNLPPNVIIPTSDTDQEITIDYMKPLFGTPNETADSDDYDETFELSLDDEDSEDLEFNDQPTRTSGNVFGANADCGICYRVGHVPGYTKYGFDRTLFTTHNIEDIYGYHVDKSKGPHLITKLDTVDGYADFKLQIPKYFKSAQFIIKNNHVILKEDELYLTDNSPLTLAYLQAHAGEEIVVRCLSEEFTHAIVDFDFGIPPVHANLSQTSKAIDWTKMDTQSTVNLILPVTIGEISNSDFVYVPSRALTLKITDTPYLRTANNVPLDWSANSRVVQLQEPSKLIHIMKKFI
jgi:hypothetical protein